MSIQYAGGTIINATFTQSAGTRAELAQWIRDQLILAGWTSTGSATNYVLTSAVTPQSLQACAQVYDPGSGVCARIKMRNASGTKAHATDLYLLPAAGKAWRIIANRYQFFVFTPGTSVAREFSCGGTLWVPPFLAATEVIWGSGNGATDVSVSIGGSWRTRLSTYGAVANGSQVGIYNGTVYDGGAGGGAIGLVAQVAPYLSTLNSGSRWRDDSVLAYDPLVYWTTTLLASNEGKITGQLYDAIVLTSGHAPDATITYDGRTFMAITGNNLGTGSDANGTLFVAVN